jgi:AcrR family transcriptional regulator
MARPRSDIAPRVLAAARARFLADGVDGASLRGIAKDAHTSIGMVYYYFPSKDDLFLAVVEEVYGRLLDDLARALAEGAPVAVRLARMYARFGAASEDELRTVRMLAREALVSSKRLERVLERFTKGHIPLVLSTLADGVQSGELASGTPPIVMMMATMSLAILPQVVRRMMAGMPPFVGVPDGDALARALAGVLLHGLVSPGG